MSDNNSFDDEKFSDFPEDESYFDGNQPYEGNEEFEPMKANASPFGSKKAKKKASAPRPVHVPAPKRGGLEERDYKPVRSGRNGKTGCMGGVMYFVFIISISVILTCLAWMAASDVLALNKAELTAEVTLPQEIFTKYQREVKDKDGNVTGTKPDWKVNNMGDVARILKDAGIIEYKTLFKFYSGFSHANEKLDPGTYELSTQYDYRALVKKMQFGSDSQVRTKVTFPEGFTNKQIFARLQENKICQYDELMQCAATDEFAYSFLKDIPLGDASRLEGFLFPDTYEFYQGMTPHAAIDTFLQIFNKRLTKEMLELSAARGFTIQQTLNVASMIEKEAANDAERAKIASVIYNRLKSNMPLGIDATIQYALPEHKEVLTAEDLAIDSPYNSRKYPGLPPTPVANPGMASIMAALKPEATNLYYYALDMATKTHKFFTNAGEFN
ncbi:MAG: endolytic transglycosylase MltG, partial [Oscillospiraceae bacterium]